MNVERVYEFWVRDSQPIVAEANVTYRDEEYFFIDINDEEAVRAAFGWSARVPIRQANFTPKAAIEGYLDRLAGDIATREANIATMKANQAVALQALKSLA